MKPLKVTLHEFSIFGNCTKPWVVLPGETNNGNTINKILSMFKIEPSNKNLKTNAY